ncbi:MAG: glycoside hydrolase family 88 protein, partial [Kiritimatiellae bacterium]|nr:glycoside hydrolase family 88 protein [Kiritimatiellia bacterium]
LWNQLVDRPDDPRNWGETSCSAMFAYAFVTGVKRGWLPKESYGPAFRKAWLALCDRLDEFANISDVCVGTGKKDDLQYYFDRPRVNGDPHGQAPMLWIASVLLEK